MPKVADPSALGLGGGPRGAPSAAMPAGGDDIERQWGRGARLQPDGSIAMITPKGKYIVLKGSPTDFKLTEDQGKAQTYARLMAASEPEYLAAINEGYDPNHWRVIAARLFEGGNKPTQFGRMVGSAFRNDLQDRAQQAEFLYQDPYLKSMTGAASTGGEDIKAEAILATQPFQNIAVMGPQTRRAREQAYEAALIRSGPARATLPAKLPSGPEAKKSALPTNDAVRQSPGFAAYNAAAKQGRIDKSKPFGTRANPYVARSEEVANRLPKGSYVYLPNGQLGVVE